MKQASRYAKRTLLGMAFPEWLAGLRRFEARARAMIQRRIRQVATEDKICEEPEWAKAWREKFGQDEKGERRCDCGACPLPALCYSFAKRTLNNRGSGSPCCLKPIPN